MTASTLDTAPRVTTGRGAVSNGEPLCFFFLGTHQPGWLALSGLDGPTSTPAPLFISDRRLRHYRRLPRATTTWALDSGGFTELATHGSWDHGPTPAQYVARIRRYHEQIGQLAWAAPQDWMCEPLMLAKTGLSVIAHQHRTVDNYLQLHDLGADLPIIPVVQGWTVGDYLHCVDLYARAGVNLTTARLVGVGSVCRRQDTTEAGRIITALHECGVTRLHGFGFKVLGLRRYAALLTSADSMAWSATARRQPPLPGCHSHATCANCPRYAYRWRQDVLAATNRPAPVQPGLFPLHAAVAA